MIKKNSFIRFRSNQSILTVNNNKDDDDDYSLLRHYYNISIEREKKKSVCEEKTFLSHFFCFFFDE